uniref:Epoxide hydrolase 2 n=1 Tax=Anas zonorhyncha TaxID=75864 RepID=A0A8B9VWY0_9AVES
MSRRAVLFDLGGVLFGPGLQHHLGSCERDCGLPSNFLRDVLLAGGPDSPHAKLMRGQITLSQLFSEAEEGCKQRASAAGIALPPTFSIARAFEEMATKGVVNAPLLRAAGVLRRNGFKTGIFTNNWVDDSSGRLFTATLLGALRRHFDVVIESCRAGLHKPDPRLYAHALEVLQAKPQDVILLDDIGENLKPARELGMATILVRDTQTVLKELQELSGVQLLHEDEPLPTACDPADVSHGYVPIRPGVQLHFVEMGQGPPICLCHGFPEVWLSWRYQIPALADAGFRVIALEMKGYGESTAPLDIEEYSQEQICKDLAIFLDKMGIPQAVFIGHDWGGAVVWHMALFYPERVRAVASLNTPYRPADPSVDIVEKMKSIPTFDYQFYFQEPGVAEAELEKDVGRTLKALIRSTRKEGSPELVPEHAAQLALGAHRQGQEDPDARADGDGGEGRGAAPQHEQGHGGVGAAAAPGSPGGVRPLDADGEACGAEQDPGGVAGGAPPRRGHAQGVPAVSGAGGGPPPKHPKSPPLLPASPPPHPGGLPVLRGCAQRGLDALVRINAAAKITLPTPKKTPKHGEIKHKATRGAPIDSQRGLGMCQPHVPTAPGSALPYKFLRGHPEGWGTPGDSLLARKRVEPLLLIPPPAPRGMLVPQHPQRP